MTEQSFDQAEMLKQINQFQEIFSIITQEVNHIEQQSFVGMAEVGMVIVTIVSHNITDIQIDPSLLKPESKNQLTSFIIQAHQKALLELDRTKKARIQEIASLYHIPEGLLRESGLIS